ncbi:MAG: 50S ribosomal protein L24 [Clostridia bacterium]|nr:50S ribosomal protein L24 [Clostridia bacterium]
MANLNVKTGDTVLVISGKDAGKQGKVLSVAPKAKRVVVEGVNLVSKTHKARSAQDKSEIRKVEGAIDISNVMPICPKCGKATRVHHAVVDGKKVRVCKCGANLDEKAAKVEKKTASKKAAPAEPVAEEKPVKKAAVKTAAKKTSKAAETKVKATKAASTKKTTTTGKSSQRGV